MPVEMSTWEARSDPEAQAERVATAMPSSSSMSITLSPSIYLMDTDNQVGQTLGGVAVDDDFGNAGHQTVPEFVPQGLDAGQALRHLLFGHLRGHAQAHDADEVLGAGPALVFLHAAVQQGPHPGAFATYSAPTPGGP
jgi:hypothetical protein